MNQKERIADLVSRLDLRAKAHLLDELIQLVGETQNGPPEGGADGSVNELDWNITRRFVEHLTHAMTADGVIRLRFPIGISDG